MNKLEIIKKIKEIHMQNKVSWVYPNVENVKVVVEDLKIDDIGEIVLNVAIYDAETNRYIDFVEVDFTYFENETQKVVAENKIKQSYDELLKLVSEIY